MTSPYTRVRNTRVTPQNLPIPGSTQVANSAGGFSWTVSPWQRLRRFLILGSEKGTYYIGEDKLTEQNARCVEECLDLDHERTLREIAEISDGGLATKNTPAIFALALAFAHKNVEVRKAAEQIFPKVIRIGTHLLQFCDIIKGMRGWGNVIRRTIANWYLSKSPDNLAYQLAKYQNREGWTQRDVLRLVHPKAGEGPLANALGWAAGTVQYVPEDGGFHRLAYDAETKTRVDRGALVKEQVPHILYGVEQAKRTETINSLLPLIDEYGLTREMIPTEFLNKDRTWEGLLKNTKLTALIRNLGNLSKNGYLEDGKHDHIDYVVNRLTDEEDLRRQRVHPIQVLLALTTYEAGRGVKGSGTWKVVPRIVSALNDAFYRSFHNVEAIGQDIYVGLDVSASMRWSTIAGSHLSAAVAAAAMSMLYVRTEKRVTIKAFADELKDLPLNDKMSLAEVMARTEDINFGGTDCALPMLDAMKRKLHVDLFMVLTDSETWAGGIHPSQALRQYRDTMNKDAKLVVVGMTSSGFTIADPNDAGMLDVVGMDASVPSIIRAFALGQV